MNALRDAGKRPALPNRQGYSMLVIAEGLGLAIALQGLPLPEVPNLDVELLSVTLTRWC